MNRDELCRRLQEMQHRIETAFNYGGPADREAALREVHGRLGRMVTVLYQSADFTIDTGIQVL